LPDAVDVFDSSDDTQVAFGADLLRDPHDFDREHRELVNHVVDGVTECCNLAERLDVDLS
jgi:hypothetical protein